MWRTLLACWVLTVVIASASFGADTHYVSHAGSDTFPYTSWATATDSILLAIDAADEWDTVRLAAGVFTADTLGLKKGLAFIGAGRDSTRIAHNGNDPQCIYLIDSCLVQGIHLQGITDTTSGNVNFHLYEGVLGLTDQSAVVRDCRLSDIQYCVSTLWTDLVHPEKRVVLENNEFSNFLSAADYLFASCRIVGNTFIVNNSDIGNPIKLLEGNAEIRKNTIIRTVQFSQPSIDLSQCDTIWVQNNVCISAPYPASAMEINIHDVGFPTVGFIENNLCLGGWSAIVSQGGNILIRNNIIVGTRQLALFYDTMLTTPGHVGFNLFWQNGHEEPLDMAFRSDPGNIFANPMFIDSLAFHLQAFSPAIDAGDPSILDIDGSPSDIGPYGGPFGETYTYVDLPPAVPMGFTDGGFENAKQTLTWRRNSESDFARYELFRDMFPIESADSTLLRAVITADTTYADTLELPLFDYYFRLRAVDSQGNASALSNEIWHIHAAVDDDEPVTPRDFVLHPNYPNPFNASTRVSLDVPTPGRLEVRVYDVLGRHVRSLHNGAVDEGSYDFDWNSHDVGSGVYFIVAKFGGTTRVRKALLLK